MTEYGEVRVDSGWVIHRAGRFCGASPRHDWRFEVTSVRLVGERTTPNGPSFDQFYIFVAVEPCAFHELPAEVFEASDAREFFQALEEGLGSPLVHRLGASVVCASSVMWPPVLVGERVFEPRVEIPGWGLRAIVARFRQSREPARLAAPIRERLGIDPRWAI